MNRADGGGGRVCILLALYRGSDFLAAQLDSYAAQTWADWSLLVSDDSPGDAASDAILAAFRAAHPAREIAVGPGPRAGVGANFLSLLAGCPRDVPYAALSDQDDVWLPHKLERAVTMLDAVPPGEPAVYCARTLVTDAELNPVAPSWLFSRPPGFRNALVQSVGGGNTMVMNRAALDLLAEAAAEAGEIVVQDWWIYQIVTACGGRILRDSEPVLLYRQHGGNQIGANLSLGARLSRVAAVMGGRFTRWNAVNMAALARSEHRFTAEARAVLAAFRAARSGPVLARLRALRASGVYRQSKAGTVALYVACALGRV